MKYIWLVNFIDEVESIAFSTIEKALEYVVEAAANEPAWGPGTSLEVIQSIMNDCVESPDEFGYEEYVNIKKVKVK